MSETTTLRALMSADDLVLGANNFPTGLRTQSLYGTDEIATGGESADMTYFQPLRMSWHTFDEATHVTIHGTGWGDYAGSAVDRSNARSLVRDYPETFVTLTGGYGSEELALHLDQEFDTEMLVDLCETLRVMADEYPLYDEDDHGRLEMELEEEDVHSWGLHDWRRELDEILAAELELAERTDLDSWLLADEVTDDALEDEWWALRSGGDGGEWYAETAVSGYFDRATVTKWLRGIAGPILRDVLTDEEYLKTTV